MINKKERIEIEKEVNIFVNKLLKTLCGSINNLKFALVYTSS